MRKEVKSRGERKEGGMSKGQRRREHCKEGGPG